MVMIWNLLLDRYQVSVRQSTDFWQNLWLTEVPLKRTTSIGHYHWFGRRRPLQ